MTLTKTASVIGVKGNGVAGMERREGSVTSWPSGSTSSSGSSLFSVGEDEIQRNNQEIRKSGKERDKCWLSTTKGIAVAHPWI
jgi:hypothetical protein